MEALVDALSDTAVVFDTSVEREFEQRLADCSRLVFRVALAVLRNTADADDVSQEAFVKAYRHFRHLRDRDRFRSWIVRVTWRLAIDRLRATARRERYEIAGLHPRPASTVEKVGAEREFHEHLDQAIDALPEKLRQVLVLAAIEGYDMTETSQLLGVPIGTVRSRLHHARKQLVKRLKWLASGMKKS